MAIYVIVGPLVSIVHDAVHAYGLSYFWLKYHVPSIAK